MTMISCVRFFFVFFFLETHAVKPGLRIPEAFSVHPIKNCRCNIPEKLLVKLILTNIPGDSYLQHDIGTW